jgi:hypothetical protein
MTCPSVEESFGRLRRSGWSVGETGSGAGWLVTGTNGENAIRATGRTPAEAWWRACAQARTGRAVAGGGGWDDKRAIDGHAREADMTGRRLAWTVAASLT